MTEPSLPTYADWKAPAGDGELLLWPNLPKLLSDAQSNHEILNAAEAPVQGVPLADVRRAARSWIGHADDAQLLFATGHQSELIHAGVWIKDVVIDHAARATGGQAYHISVNTDSPKHLALKWPGRSTPLTDDPNASTAEWSGQLAPPSAAHLATLSAALAGDSAAWPFQPLLEGFLRTLRRQSMEAHSLDAAMVYAIHEMDWQLGLRHHAMLLSPLLQSEPYLTFAYHVLARARSFAADYNAALADYRRDAGIKNPGRPMPDLAVTADSCEAPFWLDDVSTGARLRAAVTFDGDSVQLAGPNGHVIAFDSAAPADTAVATLRRWLVANNLQLAPRALTLTMFMRLFIADQFVHGIGGGRYDQVTDRLIVRHFGIQPPAFSVATATLYFPTAGNEQRVCLPCLKMEGHHLQHAVLGEAKISRVQEIDALPRRSVARARAFADLQLALRAAPPTAELMRWQSTYAAAVKQHASEGQIFDRELFYAIQPADRLVNLIKRVHQS